VFSALETFVIIALHKSTFTIPYHAGNKCEWLSPTATTPAAHQSDEGEFDINETIFATANRDSDNNTK